MSKAPPPGIYVPLMLWFEQSGGLDTDANQAHIRRLAEGGVTGIVIQESLSGAQDLSPELHKQAIDLTRRTLDEGDKFTDVRIIAGFNARSTAQETIKACMNAKEAGASYALVPAPSMASGETNQFFEEVANSSDVPPILIDSPPTIAPTQGLDSNDVRALADCANIVGTKLLCGNIDSIHRITNPPPSTEFVVYTSGSGTLIPGLFANSAGAIADLINLVPRLHRELYMLFQDNGRSSEMRDLQNMLVPGEWAVSTIGVDSFRSAITDNFGYGTPDVRSPRTTLQELLALLRTLAEAEKKRGIAQNDAAPGHPRN